MYIIRFKTTKRVLYDIPPPPEKLFKSVQKLFLNKFLNQFLNYEYDRF